MALPLRLSLPSSAPVTLAGAVVQHAAEVLVGVTIHQFAGPGAPLVWGGAPAIFDMRTGNAPMGAIETAMLEAACAQVGKSLGVVDANTASEADLASMPGMTPVLAKALRQNPRLTDWSRKDPDLACLRDTIGQTLALDFSVPGKIRVNVTGGAPGR